MSKIIAEGFVKPDDKPLGDIKKTRLVEITTYLEPLINSCMETARDLGGRWMVKDLHPVATAEGFWSVTIMRIGAD